MPDFYAGTLSYSLASLWLLVDCVGGPTVPLEDVLADLGPARGDGPT
jgi:hypothetical protein